MSTPAGDLQLANALCAVDGTEGSYAAVGQAASLAGGGGHLTLLEVTSFRAEGRFRGPAISPMRAKEILDRAAAIATAADVSVTSEVDPATPPAQVILEWSAEHDLLAMGAPSTRWFGGMFTGGATVAAMGSLPTPVLAARPCPESAFPARILVASDGLEGSDELVALAARLARAHGATVTVLHAIASQASVGPERIGEQARRAGLSPDASEVRFEAENPRTAIVEAAGVLDADLVIMGSRRLEGLHVVGSVSRRVVHGAHCSVLLVPPELLRTLPA
jgi:nucleotide-binding universal stress UspA family protein